MGKKIIIKNADFSSSAIQFASLIYSAPAVEDSMKSNAATNYKPVLLGDAIMSTLSGKTVHGIQFETFNTGTVSIIIGTNPAKENFAYTVLQTYDIKTIGYNSLYLNNPYTLKSGEYLGIYTENETPIGKYLEKGTAHSEFYAKGPSIWTIGDVTTIDGTNSNALISVY